MRHLLAIVQSERRYGRVIRFILTGGTAALLEFIVLAVLIELLHVSHAVAGSVSLIPSVIYVFLMNKYFTFRNHERRHRSQALKFVLVYALAIALNITIYNALVWVGVFYPVAKALAIGMVAVLNYLLSHGFIFRQIDTEPVLV